MPALKILRLKGSKTLLKAHPLMLTLFTSSVSLEFDRVQKA